MIDYIIIGLFGLSVLTLFAYFYMLIFFYKKLGRDKIKFSNTFPYEVVPQIGTEYFYINTLLFLSLLSSSAIEILFMVDHVEIMAIVFCAAGVILNIILAIIPFINIKILKEHLYADLGMVVLFFAITGFLTFYCMNWNRAYGYQNVGLIIALVISALLLLLALYFIFNPRLFDLKMKVSEEKSERPGIIHLAFTEWLILWLSPMILIPILLIALI